MMANKGELGGATFLSREAWEEMHLNPTDGVLVQKSIKVIYGTNLEIFRYLCVFHCLLVCVKGLPLRPEIESIILLF